MELAPSLGLAGRIVDLVSTGRTLEQNGLVETARILEARIFIGQKLATRTWLAILAAGLGIVYMYGSQFLQAFADPAIDTANLVIGSLTALCVPVAAAINWTLVQRSQRSGHVVDLVPAVLVGAVLSTLLALPLAAAAGALGGALASLPARRLGGLYFGMSTLAFALIGAEGRAGCESKEGIGPAIASVFRQQGIEVVEADQGLFQPLALQRARPVIEEAAQPAGRDFRVIQWVSLLLCCFQGAGRLMGRPRYYVYRDGLVARPGSAIPVQPDEAVQDQLAIDSQAVVLVLVGDPGAAVAKAPEGIAAVVELHVHVLGIDGAGHRHPVSGQLRLVVEGAPIGLLGQQVGGLLERHQLAELLEHPGEDHLAGEGVHAVGAIEHADQPMHAGNRPDSGGNRFQVSLRTPLEPEAYARKSYVDGVMGTNLHSVWDYYILASRGLALRDYADALGRAVAKKLLEQDAEVFIFGERGKSAPKGIAGGGEAAVSVCFSSRVT